MPPWCLLYQTILFCRGVVQHTYVILQLTTRYDYDYVVGLRQIVRSFEASFGLITFGCSFTPPKLRYYGYQHVKPVAQVLSLLVEAAIYIFFDVIVV